MADHHKFDWSKFGYGRLNESGARLAQVDGGGMIGQAGLCVSITQVILTVPHLWSICSSPPSKVVHWRSARVLFQVEPI
jgi:hypothetical protein